DLHRQANNPTTPTTLLPTTPTPTLALNHHNSETCPLMPHRFPVAALVAPMLMLFVGPSRQFQELITGFGLLALSLFSVFCGVWAYQYDQREQRFRFLADRGVPPELAWLSKQIVRLSVVATAVLSLFFSMALIFILHRPMHSPFDLASYLTIIAVTNYSVGQLFGQLIRSPIVATFLACLFSGLLFAWTICVEQIHVPIVFQFAPAAILLAASYLRSRDWMEERRSLAAWSRLTASVLVPFALLYCGIGLYRMSGVPQVDQAVVSKNLIRPSVVKYEPAVRNGQSNYSMISEVFGGERAAMFSEIGTIIRAAKEQSVQRPIDPNQPNLDSPPQNEALIREIEVLMQQGYLEHYHAALVSVLAEQTGPVRWPLAEPLLRELHARHFTVTRQLFRTATRDSNLIWPEELYRNRGEWQEFKPLSYLLALSADAAMRAGRWEEAIEDALGLWRFSRQIMRQPPQYEWTLSNHAIRLADQQLVSVAEKSRSPELIRRIIRELSATGPAWPSSTDDVREQWAAWDQTTLESNLISTVHRQGMQSRNFGIMPTFLNRVFPWELSRSRRELSGLFAARLAIWEAIDAVVRDGHADRVRLIPPSPPTQTRPATTVANVKQPVAQPTALMPEERLLQQSRPLFQQSLFLSFSDKTSPPINDILRREVWHRTLILRLALIAWRHEHGQLPERLEDLVGPYLERLPLDPLSGKPYLLLKTLEEFQQWAPESTLTTQNPEWLKEILPGIFTPSLRMGGELRVTRPDGRGETWIEFDSPSDSTRGWGLSSPKQ
ncbi:MAG: hypothetical protein NT013_08120, partial [Planctomycetia bacterium]|nr:hypothetical protein [Planctomycetia bacterium]